MTDLSPELNDLGNALESAAEADLRAGTATARRRRRPTRIAIVVAAVAILVPGVALAASQLVGTDEVEQSLPAGTLALAGTNPTCTVVEQEVEYLCTLERAPAPEVSDWTGTVEPTVDATKHVNGGCRSLAADGRTWRCYLGRAAVEQQIVGPQLLGEYAPSPGRG